jgi:hypothetical protein
MLRRKSIFAFALALALLAASAATTSAQAPSAPTNTEPSTNAGLIPWGWFGEQALEWVKNKLQGNKEKEQTNKGPINVFAPITVTIGKEPGKILQPGECLVSDGKMFCNPQKQKASHKTIPVNKGKAAECKGAIPVNKGKAAVNK